MLNISWVWLLCYSVGLILVLLLILKLIKRVRKNELTELLSEPIDIAKVFKDKPVYFMNIKIKPDGNLIYYVESTFIKEADNINLKWVVIDYIKDGEHRDVKLPSSMIFISLKEANTFVNGGFTTQELNHILETWQWQRSKNRWKNILLAQTYTRIFQFF